MLRADQALALAQVNRVVPDESLLSEAFVWAEMLKRVPPMYIKALKRGHPTSHTRRPPGRIGLP